MNYIAHTPCDDCHQETWWCIHQGAEFYRVNDELWAHAGMDRGILCIGCLELRIGRRLTPDDFPDAPINKPQPGRHSERLLSRLQDWG